MNDDVARTLEELADFLESKGELFFKVRSYRKAAAAIRELGVPLEEFQRSHDLKEIPGVGEAIAGKIAAMLRQGPRVWLEAYEARKSEG